MVPSSGLTTNIDDFRQPNAKDRGFLSSTNPSADKSRPSSPSATLTATPRRPTKKRRRGRQRRSPGATRNTRRTISISDTWIATKPLTTATESVTITNEDVMLRHSFVNPSHCPRAESKIIPANPTLYPYRPIPNTESVSPG
uniref:Uncharacterized protein n=1 Tax=Steinernema glaseri TaxID=37863 RepID=A0A1I8A3K3_9BILA